MKRILEFGFLISFLVIIFSSCAGGSGSASAVTLGLNTSSSSSSSSSSSTSSGGSSSSTSSGGSSSGGSSSGGSSSGGSSSGGSSSSSSSVASENLFVTLTLVDAAGSSSSYDFAVGSSSSSGAPYTSLCQIDQSASPGTEVICRTMLPQQDLFQNEVVFSWGTNNSAACPYYKLYPYYYRASNDADFQPSWNDFATTDCSADNEGSVCYSGIGTQIIADFPSTGIDYVINQSSQQSSASFTAPSAASSHMFSNRWIANPPEDYPDLDGSGNIASGTLLKAFYETLDLPAPGYYYDGLVGDFTTGNSNDIPNPNRAYYWFTCEDAFATQLYDIKLYITDQVSSAGNNGTNVNDPTVDKYGAWLSTNQAIDPN